MLPWLRWYRDPHCQFSFCTQNTHGLLVTFDQALQVDGALNSIYRTLIIINQALNTLVLIAQYHQALIQANMSKRKHFAYTLEFKLKIVSEVEGKKLTETEICKKHSIPNSTLSTILKDLGEVTKGSRGDKISPENKKDGTQQPRRP